MTKMSDGDFLKFNFKKMAGNKLGMITVCLINFTNIFRKTHCSHHPPRNNSGPEGTEYSQKIMRKLFVELLGCLKTRLIRLQCIIIKVLCLQRRALRHQFWSLDLSKRRVRVGQRILNDHGLKLYLLLKGFILKIRIQWLCKKRPHMMLQVSYL